MDRRTDEALRELRLLLIHTLLDFRRSPDPTTLTEPLAKIDEVLSGLGPGPLDKSTELDAIERLHGKLRKAVQKAMEEAGLELTDLRRKRTHVRQYR